MTLYWLGTEEATDFPPVRQALRDPNGLLAAGGDLSPRRLLSGYQTGVFPWYSSGQPILWWSPDPRTVLIPDRFHLSRSLKKSIRRHAWRISVNAAFEAVVIGCAEPRASESETWITEDMREAYCRLHKLGWAHSVEVWIGDDLVGGIYGVAIDRLFCGESMFMRRTNASKIALFALCRLLSEAGFAMLDCQMHTPHLESLGAREIPRDDYLEGLLKFASNLKVWRPAHTSMMASDLLA
ncbi:MAG: leucyl/phenylalanyl-tRNA--protein transferase [Pseudomonadota bacterium]